jgi:hypothetical protein
LGDVYGPIDNSTCRQWLTGPENACDGNYFISFSNM